MDICSQEGAKVLTIGLHSPQLGLTIVHFHPQRVLESKRPDKIVADYHDQLSTFKFCNSKLC